MPIKSFRFTQFADLRAEGVGSLNASFTLSLHVAEDNVKEGKKLQLSASMICNAAKAYGSGKVIPWCTVKNNVNHNKYILDTKGKSFSLGLDEILIGSSIFIIPYKKNIHPILEVQAGYVLDTGYTGTVRPFPLDMTQRISLNKFNMDSYEKQN
ncbi:hypothetical protein [Erwinia sp. MYb416]|uniref:hypothetical protein n=1 Tax=Erwinia sp. MYb416 TaxID=3108532 RepID=UPI003097D013